MDVHFSSFIQPCTILSKILQDDELCITEAIEAILKNNKDTEKLKATKFDNLTTVKKVTSRIQDIDDGATYQGVQITHYKEAVTVFHFIRMNL